MATLSDIYNKVKLGEDLAEKGMATTADYLTSNPELISPYNTYGIASAVEANTSTNYNPLESLGTAASGFVRGVGGIPGLDKIAEPIASGIDQLHSEGYNVSRIARQARNDSFDERNQTKYLSDLSEYSLPDQPGGWADRGTGGGSLDRVPEFQYGHDGL